MSGYGLHKWLAKEGPFLGYTPQPSQIYRQLSKCLDRGWVDLRIDKDTGGPEAKVYRLTEGGIEKFKEWANSPYKPSVRPLDADFQMRMLLTGVLGPQVALRVLRTELEYRRKQEATSEPYSNGDDHRQSAVPIDPEWNRELVRTVGERSFLLGRANLTWLQMTHDRLVAQIGEESPSGVAAEPLT